MKKVWVVVLILFMLPCRALADMTGAEAPDFSLQNINGNTISLAKYSGKVLMMVHFNTYCHSCREEVPKVNSIVQKYKNLQVIGVAIGNDKEEVAEFRKTSARNIIWCRTRRSRYTQNTLSAQCRSLTS